MGQGAFRIRFPGVTGTFSGRLGILKLLGHFPGEMWVACWKGERAKLETSAPRPEFRSRIPVEIVPFSGRVKSRSSQVTLGYEPSDLGFYQGWKSRCRGWKSRDPWRKSSRPWGCSVGGNQVDLGENQVDLGSSRLEAKPWVKVRFVFAFRA